MPVADSPQEVLRVLGIDFRERTNRLLLCCPFHHDTNPSSGFYLNTKLFHCFACEISLDTVAFYAKFKGWDREQAEAEIGELPPNPQDKNVVAVIRHTAETILLNRKDLPRVDHALLAEKVEKMVWAYQQALITKKQLTDAFQRWRTQVENT